MLKDEHEKELREKIDILKDRPSIVERCPRCKELSFVFDSEQRKLVCKKCGFSLEIPTME